MKNFFEKYIARSWNRRIDGRTVPVSRGGLVDIGAEVVDGEPTGRRVGIAQDRRAEGLTLVGKSGSGKTSLMRHLKRQDIEHDRYFADCDQHGEEMSFLLKTVTVRERVLKKDKSDRFIPIDPADPEFSVGFNPLEGPSGPDRFVQIAEFAQILKDRWHLDTLGARTDELLRNSLFALAESNMTLVELAPFLSDVEFRSRCLMRVTSADVRDYFALRFDQASDAMRRVMAEPVLNKVSLFVSDPRFRHLLGQRHSTFSLVDAMDSGRWISLKLDKGQLGEQAATFVSLFIAKVRHAYFARRKRDDYGLYCDELPSLIAFGGDLENILAEARKKGGSVTSASQFLAQHSPQMQAALLSVGSLGFFQLSSADAQHIAAVLDGGKALAERLKNLPRRHLIFKTVNEPWREAIVPTVREPDIDPSDLYRRSRARWARPRREIEAEIRSRREVGRRTNPEGLDGWE